MSAGFRVTNDPGWRFGELGGDAKPTTVRGRSLESPQARPPGPRSLGAALHAVSGRLRPRREALPAPPARWCAWTGQRRQAAQGDRPERGGQSGSQRLGGRPTRRGARGPWLRRVTGSSSPAFTAPPRPQPCSDLTARRPARPLQRFLSPLWLLTRTKHAHTHHTPHTPGLPSPTPRSGGAGLASLGCGGVGWGGHGC